MLTKRLTSIVLTALVILIWALPHRAESDNTVSYPQDYRKRVQPRRISPTIVASQFAMELVQRADAETVRRIEREWVKAFVTGDSDYLESLLAPDYESIWHTGEVRTRQQIIDKARVHRDKPLPVPQLDEPKIQIHGNAAISIAEHVIVDPVTKQQKRVRFMDFFVFDRGRWQAIYTTDVALKDS